MKSKTMSETFGAVDYIILVGMLMISTIIGFYYAWKDRNNKDENEFLRGGNKMSVAPVCISILASFLSSTGLIGIPTVVYFTGTQFWIVVIPAFLAATLACEVFIPIYYRMKLVSVNEYIYRRFSSQKLRVAANISVLYAPSIALSIVTEMSITSSILIMGLIVTVYTSLGGLKGVIWTDFFQFAIMLFGLLAVVVRGANVSGGIAAAFDRAYIGGRIEFWNMDFNIYSSNSFWVMFFGFTVLWCGTLSTSQLQVQRSVCMPSLSAAKKALYFAIPGFMTMISLSAVMGVLMYAHYYDCDPMLTERVTRPDQLVPYFVLDIFSDSYPGMTGVFVACIFGSSLSTLSSGLNAMSSIIYDDYGKRFVPKRYAVYATKMLAVLIGVLSIALAFVMKEMKSILECTIMLYGASNGPMFGLFCLGLFFPWSNAWGGGFGLIVGQVFCLWITVGSVVDKRTDFLSMGLPSSTEGCYAQNITVNYPGTNLTELTHYKTPQYYPEGIHLIHHMSPYFVPTIGFIITLIVGNIVSLLTKGNKDNKVDPNLVHIDVCRVFEKILPQSWRRFETQTDEKPKINGQFNDIVLTSETISPSNPLFLRKRRFYGVDSSDLSEQFLRKL
ncbi:unnamed protein product [Medioppia subpectinata]|uniref:Sodium-coupled monocarboxylate transporter 1 n=1 Tax=Medioppia subpectinata TaxID=1979941 RepID=A0A7R9PSV8_9ACAR|nr:unnamed protein product [Medioppia subpectinata]CAG2100033.1 unnamed protein product [Medioppia subpectinata]